MKDFCNDVYNPQKINVLAFLDSYLHLIVIQTAILEEEAFLNHYAPLFSLQPYSRIKFSVLWLYSFLKNLLLKIKVYL